MGVTPGRDSLNLVGVNASNILRVVASALVMSTLSFAAGVAGDLSLVPPPQHGARIVVRIPPQIPANAVRAAPLPRLLSTASAEASPIRRARFQPIIAHTTHIALIEVPTSEIILANAFAAEEVHAAKANQRKGG